MSHMISFLKSEMLGLWNVLTAYRPERHYMRGPGPKWRRKHAAGGGLHTVQAADKHVAHQRCTSRFNLSEDAPCKPRNGLIKQNLPKLG